MLLCNPSIMTMSAPATWMDVFRAVSPLGWSLLRSMAREVELAVFFFGVITIRSKQTKLVRGHNDCGAGPGSEIKWTNHLPPPSSWLPVLFLSSVWCRDCCYSVKFSPVFNQLGACCYIQPLKCLNTLKVLLFYFYFKLIWYTFDISAFISFPLSYLLFKH